MSTKTLDLESLSKEQLAAVSDEDKNKVAENRFEEYSAKRKLMIEQEEVPEWMITQGFILFEEKYKTFPEETVKGRFKTISRELSRFYTPNPKLAKARFFDIMWRGILAPSTPVYANIGRKTGGHAVSCSGGYFGDSIRSFYTGHLRNALLCKNGYGTSDYLGDISPRGTPIPEGGKANGVLDVLENATYAVAGKVSQGSTRRGSWAGYLPMMHGDFDEVFNYTLRNPATVNVGWIIYDKDIAAIEAGDKETIRRLTEICYLRTRFGKGYVFKADAANRLAPMEISESGVSIKASNLCVTGDSLFHTGKGVKTAKELYETQESFKAVVDGRTEISGAVFDRENDTYSAELEGVSSVSLRPTNGMHLTQRKTNVYNIATDCGYNLTSTLDHKYFVYNDYTNKIDKKPLKDINPETDQLCLQSSEGYFSDIGSYEEGVSAVRALREEGIPRSITGKSREFNRGVVAEFLNGTESTILSGGGLLMHTDLHREAVLMEIVQSVLINFGIKVDVVSDEESSLFLSPSQVKKLVSVLDIDLADDYLQEVVDRCLALPDEIEEFNFAKIDRIEYYGIEDVYDTTQLESNSLIINGIVTGNCIEIMLPSSDKYTFSCVLSSLNLAHYDDMTDDDIKWATIFLDCVTSLAIEQTDGDKDLKTLNDFTRDYRAIGLGTLGYHTLLQQRSLAFGSFDAYRLNNEIFKRIKRVAHETSMQMGEEMGSPMHCKITGRRNATLMAVAPNTSSAMLCGGVSQSIEPLAANYFVQPVTIGEIVRINPTLTKLLKDKGVYSDEVLERIRENRGSVQGMDDILTEHEQQVYRTAYEIDQMDIIRQAEQRQREIDQAQSLNLFYRPGQEAISAQHMLYFLKSPYLKSLYYQRNARDVMASTGETSCVACEG